MRLKLSIIFFLLVSATYIVLELEKKQKIDQYLNNQTRLVSKLYNVHYHHYKQGSKTLFEILIKQNRIIEIYKALGSADRLKKERLRAELYEHLLNDYKKMDFIQLKQVHFHLKDNSSFLRMHKPSKYDDDLSDIRETVKYVNSSHKEIDGFEMGRVYSGLRFVYPIKDETENHLGSVEISFDISAFSIGFMKSFNLLSNFHLNKKIVDKKAWGESIAQSYQKSPIEGYYLENRNTEVLKQYSKKLGLPSLQVDSLIMKKALDKIEQQKTITLYEGSSDTVITFLPVINPITKNVVAFFSIRGADKFVQNKINNSNTAFFISVLLLGIIFYLISKEFLNKERLNEYLNRKVEEETKLLSRSKDKLMEQKNFLDILIQTLPIPLFCKDIDGNYIDVNETWCEFTGFSKEEIIGKSVYDVAPKHIADIYHEQDLKVFSLEENPQVYESKVVNKDTKQEFEVMFYKSAFFDDKGNVRGLIGSVVDLTKIKQLEKENIQREKQFFEQSKMADMGNMISNIAHQWRQPLSVISTSASGIQLNKEYGILTDEVLDSSLENIIDNVNYLSKTIDIFRDFIKEEKLKKEVVLQDRVDNVLRVVDTNLSNNYIKLINEIDYSAPIEISLVLGELSQVLINIINNAKDVLLEKEVEYPWIKIDIEKNDNKVLITIEDNGGGIKEDIMSKIFDPYFTTKHQSQGTGLGLHMSQRIVTESLDGKIYAENTKNGAKFFVELPL